MMGEFSDYVVYVDESGDHGLKSIDPDFPVFALVFCVVSKADYAAQIVPAMQAFKFQYWGHDTVVLHENEIRKEKGDFSFLMTDRVLRDGFMSDLSRIIEESPFKVIASVIDKIQLRQRHANPSNPYEIALNFCLEHLFDLMIETGQERKTVHVVFECRGAEEDRELERIFHRICARKPRQGSQNREFNRINFEPRFAKKSINSTGLQFSDLTARPVALQTVRPD